MDNLKSLVLQSYLKLLKVIFCWVKPNKQQIAFINRSGFSGSNVLAIKEFYAKNTDYKLISIDNFPSIHISFKKWFELAKSNYVFFSHEPYKINRKQTTIELWHGIPLKNMGYVANNSTTSETEKVHRQWMNNADLVVSSSNTYNTLMSACIGINGDRFINVGNFPRNELLNNRNGQLRDKLLAEFKKTDENTKIGFYMPTILSENGNKLPENAIFGFENEDLVKLDRNLAELNMCLLCKFHPTDEAQFKKRIADCTQIKIINADWFESTQLDLYNYLPHTDFLITNYSSVFFDYLMLDKPIIFAVPDLDGFSNLRGFMLDPFVDFTPGDKVVNQEQLYGALQFSTDYHNDRQRIKQIYFADENKNISSKIFEILKAKESATS